MKRLKYATASLLAVAATLSISAHPTVGGELSVVASFAVSPGSTHTPAAGPTLDSSGNLWGVAGYGGTNGGGAVWEIAAGTNTITTVATFSGTYPGGPVTIDSNGDVFGTTMAGGTYNDGTVWEIAAGTNTAVTIASFDGASPNRTNVVIDGQGNLYGTTTLGGTSNNGTVWEVVHGSNTITTLTSFSNGTVGYGPNGVIMDAAGNLYGESASGGYGYNGGTGGGIVWELAKGSNTPTLLAANNPYTGVSSGFPPVMDSSGNLYGYASGEGINGYGTLWELAKGSNTFTILFAFTAQTGSPTGLAIDSQGNLFGTTFTGGAYGGGILFEFANGTSTLTTLASFNPATDGEIAYSPIAINSSGDLFGTTLEYGMYGGGAVWEYSAVPEPSSIVMALIGLATAGGIVLVKRLRGV